MRQVYDDREFTHRIGATAAASIRHSNSRTVCAGAVTARLAALQG
jgi:hypothetical protein